MILLAVVLGAVLVVCGVIGGIDAWLYRHDPEYREQADLWNAEFEWRRDREGRDAMGGKWFP